MEDSSDCDIGCDGESVVMISNQKTLKIDLPSSSEVDINSMVSTKEGWESPLSSWDSEPENDISSISSCHIMPEESLQDVNLEGNFLHVEEQNHFVGVENMDDGFSWEIDNRSYDELLKKLVEKEEELRVSNLKLQHWEQEINKFAVQVLQIDDVCEKLELKEEEMYEQKKLLGEEISKLKIQNLKSENLLDDVRGELNLKKCELDNVRKELELKEEKLNEQKKLSEEEIFKLKNQIKESENQLDDVRGQLNLKKEELQKQTAKLDTHIPDFVYQIKNLTEQLEVAHKKLKISMDEIATLRMELGSESSRTYQLQCQIVEINEDNNIKQKEELRKLNADLFNLQHKFSCEKKNMDSDIAWLSQQKKELTSKLEHFESRNKELEKKVMRNEAENLKHYQYEIRYLSKKMSDLEATNKKSENLMIKLDEANVEIDKLKAEICSRDNEISHMKKYMNEIKAKAKLKEENKLKLEVEKLEKEVSKMKGVILDMAEEKKEAIRQLCNSLEHYRNGYNERRRALNG